ncbi:hypothetical protein ACIOTI_37165 [Streptomyces sp. NPDC087843]|uniref:hypothetical protein n=1 Tax=Streptomyces sp. NPDC087843 TaxID=3365804 RepID=UPI00382E268C
MAVTRPAPRTVPAALPPDRPTSHSHSHGSGSGSGSGSGRGSGAVVPGPRRGVAHRYAALPPPLEVALAALRLDALLGDPWDAANPYGLPALTTTSTTDRITAASASSASSAASAASAGGAGGAGEGRAGLLAAAGLGRIRSADQLVRALRPVLRRDVALGQACAAAARACPVPAALLGPAALLAATGTVLRQAARIVAGRCHSEPALRQWRPVLATVFADLLACESLTSVALRRPMRPASGALLPAVAGYVVPTVVADVLAQLELVLTECGHGPAGLEGRMLAKLAGDLPAAGVDAAAAGSWQTHLVRALPALAESPRPPHPAALPALFRLADPHPASDPHPDRASDTHPASDPHPDLACDTHLVSGPAANRQGGDGQGGDGQGGDGVVLSGLLRAAGRAAGGDPDRAALAGAARRLLSEQRALRRPCRAAGQDGPDGPAVRALADRQALLWLAAAVLGVQEGADDGRGLFLGGPHWALLALSGITERLRVPLPGPAADPREQVWAELADRVRHGVDCDIYATRLLW